MFYTWYDEAYYVPKKVKGREHSKLAFRIESLYIDHIFKFIAFSITAVFSVFASIFYFYGEGGLTAIPLFFKIIYSFYIIFALLPLPLWFLHKKGFGSILPSASFAREHEIEVSPEVINYSHNGISSAEILDAAYEQGIFEYAVKRILEDIEREKNSKKIRDGKKERESIKQFESFMNNTNSDSLFNNKAIDDVTNKELTIMRSNDLFVKSNLAEFLDAIRLRKK